MTEPRHITDAPLALERSREQQERVRQEQADREDAQLLRWLLRRGAHHLVLRTGRRIDCDAAGAHAELQAAYQDSLAR